MTRWQVPRLVVAGALAAALVSCGSMASDRRDPTASAGRSTAHEASQHNASSAPTAPLAPLRACARATPLEGYDRQELAYLPLRGDGKADLNDATLLAQDQLLDRLVGAGGCGRDELQAHVKPYRTQLDAGYACAQVAISNEAYGLWHGRHRDEARGRQAFRDSVAAALQGLGAAGGASRALTVAIADSGLVADESFRSVIEAEVRAAASQSALAAWLRPLAWDGAWVLPPLPRGLDVAVVPQYLDHGQAGDMVQVELRLRRRDARAPGGEVERSLLTASVSRCLLPAPGATTPPQRVRVDWGSARPHGVHCSGDALKPKLVSLDDAPLHVRVVNVWSKSGAMVVWPPSAAVPDRLSPRAHVPLSDAAQHWVAVESVMGTEQLLVFSSRDPKALDAELGLLRSTLGCRYQAADAERLLAMKRASRRDVHLDVVTLQVLTTGVCAGQVDFSRTLAAERVLAGIGECR